VLVPVVELVPVVTGKAPVDTVKLSTGVVSCSSVFPVFALVLAEVIEDRPPVASVAVFAAVLPPPVIA